MENFLRYLLSQELPLPAPVPALRCSVCGAVIAELTQKIAQRLPQLCQKGDFQRVRKKKAESLAALPPMRAALGSQSTVA